MREENLDLSLNLSYVSIGKYGVVRDGAGRYVCVEVAIDGI